jgi:hypothetical protein
MLCDKCVYYFKNSKICTRSQDGLYFLPAMLARNMGEFCGPFGKLFMENKLKSKKPKGTR